MSGCEDVTGSVDDPSGVKSRDDPARRRERLARMGAILSDVTADETAAGWGERDSRSDADERLAREVPPHHG